MRILLVSSSSGSRGGGEIFLLYLAKALLAAGHEPMLWCASHERMDELANRFGKLGQVYRDDYPNSYLDRKLRVFSAVFDRATTTRLSRRLADIPADIFHLNKQTLEDGLDLLAAIRKTGRPTISTIHITQSARSLGAIAGGLRDKLAVNRLKKIRDESYTCVSDARASELSKMISGTVHTIYNSVSEPLVTNRQDVRKEICEASGWPCDCVLVVCVARLVPQKDPARFINLASDLYHREPRTRFLWIGDGEMRSSFETHAKKCGLEGVVDCTGWSEDPRRYLAGADLYLHPAAYEGLPLAILEAMAASLPCVLSPEIVAEVEVFDSDNVILVKQNDDDWLQKASCAKVRNRYAKASRKLYETYFRPEAMVAKFVKLYESKIS